jgi:hypothetical protein
VRSLGNMRGLSRKGDGLRFNGEASAPGAQTERRGVPRPVSALLGRQLFSKTIITKARMDESTKNTERVSHHCLFSCYGFS